MAMGTSTGGRNGGKRKTHAGLYTEARLPMTPL